MLHHWRRILVLLNAGVVVLGRESTEVLVLLLLSVLRHALRTQVLSIVGVLLLHLSGVGVLHLLMHLSLLHLLLHLSSEPLLHLSGVGVLVLRHLDSLLHLLMQLSCGAVL
jgi:hypothetical protein